MSSLFRPKWRFIKKSVGVELKEKKWNQEYNDPSPRSLAEVHNGYLEKGRLKKRPNLQKNAAFFICFYPGPKRGSKKQINYFWPEKTFIMTILNKNGLITTIRSVIVVFRQGTNDAIS
jgi:hypothetical protein